ncbi:MAG: type II toxin-antitoxin system Phd/YefM family antitoxin [Thermodesulfobacteriota bacterium]|nr:type II toxin-antitoxin system Phd/YefM family antitoxin [Thermodesulfobacteriota bacterium]
MMTVNFTEFRKNASALFSSVELGETIYVKRHGKKIAEILPVYNENKKIPSWKENRIKLTVQGKNISKIIIEEREKS